MCSNTRCTPANVLNIGKERKLCINVFSYFLYVWFQKFTFPRNRPFLYFFPLVVSITMSGILSLYLASWGFTDIFATLRAVSDGVKMAKFKNFLQRSCAALPSPLCCLSLNRPNWILADELTADWSIQLTSRFWLVENFVINVKTPSGRKCN